MPTARAITVEVTEMISELRKYSSTGMPPWPTPENIAT
jgi:hypothetical protein